MSHLKGIKPRILHHLEYRQAERLRLLDKRESFKPEQACLMKYFPKYYKKLKTDISMKEWSLVLKLRLIKTIGHFASHRVDHIPESQKDFQRLGQKIFQNKRKSVKSLPMFNTRAMPFQPETKPKISRLFPNITRLNLLETRDLPSLGEEVMFLDRALEREILTWYQHFWKGYRNLKHLKLSNITSYSWFLVKEINSTPRFLSHLKTLKFSLDVYFDPTDLVHPRNMLHELAKNDHFLRHLTHLECEKFEGLHAYNELIRKVLAQCVNLISLSFPIGNEASRHSSSLKESFKEEKAIEALELIGKMNNLQALNVSIYEIKMFTNHFSCPKSLQKIVLNISDSHLLDLFDCEFFERWKELPNLHILKIKMLKTARLNDLLHKFVLPLLQMTPNLKKFRLGLEGSLAFNAPKCEALDLSLFNERVVALKQLGYFKVSNKSAFSPGHQIIFDPKECLFFSNLKKVNIERNFSEGFDFKSLLELYSIESKSQRSLKLANLSFGSIEPFCECVKVANQLAKFGNMLVDLKVILSIDNFEEALCSLPEPLVLEKNVIVRIFP